MKKGIVFTEGRGTLPQNDTQTEQAFQGVADGSLLLQNAFTSLFEQEIPHLSTVFVFEMSGGWKAALFNFAKKLASENHAPAHLLIDFQDVPDTTSGSKKEALAIEVAQNQRKAKSLP